MSEEEVSPEEDVKIVEVDEEEVKEEVLEVEEVSDKKEKPLFEEGVDSAEDIPEGQESKYGI